jgi:hypothetical protein
VLSLELRASLRQRGARFFCGFAAHGLRTWANENAAPSGLAIEARIGHLVGLGVGTGGHLEKYFSEFSTDAQAVGNRTVGSKTVLKRYKWF